jgi:hypothetical protein
MFLTKQDQTSELTKLTNRAVRSFWMDGLWDLAFAGVFLVMGLWGAIYVSFIAFHSSTWPAFQELGKNVAWLGLLFLIVVLIPLIWLAWLLVKHLKRTLIAPYIGHVEHRFFMPVDRTVFVWCFILYAIGLGSLYGIFTWLKGGPYMMSVPFIISPAAIFWAIGKVYGMRRYQFIAVIGLILAVSLEMLLTTKADYMMGSRNFLDVLPAWGCPTLPCLIWAMLSIVSGLAGLISVRMLEHGAK